MLYKWEKECQDWITNTQVTVLDGTPKQREKILNNWTKGVLIVSYDTFKIRNYTNKTTNAITKKGELVNILEHNPDMLIIDEFHNARNTSTMLAKSIYKAIKQIPYATALTGTPIYKDETDLFALLHFLDPEQFPNYYKFMYKYCVIEKKWTPNGNTIQASKLTEKGRVQIREFLKPLVVNRKQNDPEVMPWLPEKPIPEYILLPATPTQNKLLTELKKYYETEGIVTFNKLDRLTRERQIIQDPRLLFPKKAVNTSSKTLWVLQYLKDYPNTPTIFFSNFTEYIHLLNGPKIVGETPLTEREELVTAFQNGDIKQLFINTVAGNAGLTLDTAECIIFLDQMPPLGDILQASERFTATTPERAYIPKRIIYLVLKDTYDETLVEMTQANLGLMDILADYTNKGEY